MSELVIKRGSKKLIISFSSHAAPINGKRTFEFVNFLDANYSSYDKFFYIDMKNFCYQKGIENISTDVESTVLYLKDKIKDYEEVTIIGHSGGGYAAILFGSLLNVENVISITPPTILSDKYEGFDHLNLQEIINDKTNYYLVGDTNSEVYESHHIRHCENIEMFSNVKVYRFRNVDIREFRTSGKLLEIFKKILN